jgi:hypothetical protein
MNYKETSQLFNAAKKDPSIKNKYLISLTKSGFLSAINLFNQAAKYDFNSSLKK